LINPGRVKKFVATASVGGDRDTNRGRRIRITAIRMANGFFLVNKFFTKISLFNQQI
jgi:hypothetical protein